MVLPDGLELGRGGPSSRGPAAVSGSGPSPGREGLQKAEPGRTRVWLQSRAVPGGGQQRMEPQKPAPRWGGVGPRMDAEPS